MKSLTHSAFALLSLVAVLGFNSPANAALPACETSASDPDGDGFGWENNQSCLVQSGSSSAPPTVPGSHPVCNSASSDPDGDGYGWENNATCLTQGAGEGSSSGGNADTSAGTASSHPQCATAISDPDGDGFGWENNASCVVGNSSGASSPESPANAVTPGAPSHPICASTSSDPDGDGFGWENNASCVVGSATPTTPSTPTPSVPPMPALPPVPNSAFSATSPTGAINTGTPVFRWQAHADADQYLIEVTDAGNSGYSSVVDAFSAGCQTGVGDCEHQPNLGYFDNNLSWRVLALSSGNTIATSNSRSFTTPFSPDMQPILSNSGSCEAWAAVAYDKYVVLNNAWNARRMNNSAWSQTISADRTGNGNVVASWTYDWLGRFDGDEIEVKAYPEVLYGPKLGTHVSGTKAETGLPELVRDLPEFTIDYAYSETGNAERNVAVESFFHSSCTIAGPCDEVDNRVYEMMVWIDNPTIRTPGQPALRGVMIDNQLWDVYIKPNSNKHYIAFTAQNPQSSGRLNWNRFIEWTQNWTAANAESRGIDVLSPDFCMGAIEIGTEMWWGAGSFTLDQFDVNFTPR